MNQKPQKDDAALWESKELGADAAHAEPASADDDKALDDALGLQPVSIRLQKDLVQDLKRLAREEGLGYQPFIRSILTRYVKEHNLIAK